MLKAQKSFQLINNQALSIIVNLTLTIHLCCKNGTIIACLNTN